MGHGTHVAGILASKPSHLGFIGVAPDAELGMFRALDCFGSSTNDILLASFNMAYEAGSHIISASVGIDGGWPDDAWSMMAQRIVENGVSVVVAAGNNGELNIFRPINPAAGRGVASVASINARELPFLMLAGTYSTAESAEQKDFGWISAFPPYENLTLPLFYVGSDAETGNACEPLAEGLPDLTDYIVLVKEDDCHVDTQAVNIVAKGGRNLLYFRSGNDQ
jgi:subtilisin family serine protease